MFLSHRSRIESRNYICKDMYVISVLQSLGMKVTLPILLVMDNSGAVDLDNNQSAGGQTRHIELSNIFCMT